MHNFIRPFLSEHRIARLNAWALLMLGWLGEMLFSNATPRQRRHLRRYRFAPLNGLARLVGSLIVFRAVNVMRPRAVNMTRRDFSRPGFARRMRVQIKLRTIVSARFYKRLRQRDFTARMALLIDALDNLDAYAARIMPRLRRRLTRLRPLRATRPPQQTLLFQAAPAPHAADSS